jgi:hypothetical protein
MANLKSTSQATPKPTPPNNGKEMHKARDYLKEEQEEKIELMWQYSHAAIFVEIPPFGVGVRGGSQSG